MSAIVTAKTMISIRHGRGPQVAHFTREEGVGWGGGRKGEGGASATLPPHPDREESV